MTSRAWFGLDRLVACVGETLKPTRRRVRAAGENLARSAFLAGVMAERSRVLEIVVRCDNGPPGYHCGKCDSCAARRNIETGGDPSGYWFVPSDDLDDGRSFAPC